MITSVITFIIVLSILVLVHELGHYFVARKNGILAEEFGIGLPPKIWSKKFGDTITRFPLEGL
jgi:regulator of sigma E protease